jgi:hypothetical protein
MGSFPHWAYGFAAFYVVLGFAVYRLARKPSCRTCLNRDDCPNRVGGLSEITHVPKCVASAKK